MDEGAEVRAGKVATVVINIRAGNIDSVLDCQYLIHFDFPFCLYLFVVNARLSVQLLQTKESRCCSTHSR
jgi:hypothetical protein